MAVEATYSIIEYLKPILLTASGDSIEFEPGEPSGKGTDSSFASYSLIMDTDYEQPYIHIDTLSVKLYHRKFDKLAKMVDATLKALNNESVYDNEDLASCGDADGIKFIEVSARQRSHRQNEFVDSTEYHVGQVDILLQYVEL